MLNTYAHNLSDVICPDSLADLEVEITVRHLGVPETSVATVQGGTLEVTEETVDLAEVRLVACRRRAL